jgi:hypothetical protein
MNMFYERYVLSLVSKFGQVNAIMVFRLRIWLVCGHVCGVHILDMHLVKFGHFEVCCC